MASFVGCAFFDVKHGGTAKKDTSYGLVISALFLGLARPASVVWLIPLLAILLIRVRGAKAPWRGLPRVTIVLLSLALLASLASFVYMNGLRGGGISDHDTEGWGDLSFFTRLTVIVLKFGDLVYDGFGLLGWADTRLPMLFFVAWMVATVFAIGRAFPSNPSGSLLPTSWAFAVMAVFCLGVAGQSYLAAFGWQGRYFLPCLAAFVGLLVPTMSMRSTVPKSLRRVSITLLVTVAVIDTAALAWNSGRYLYGMSETYVRFGALPLASSLSEWHPLLGPASPFILGASGALIIVGILIAGLRGNPAPDPAPVAHPRVDTPNGESSHPDPKTSSLLVGSDETRAPRNGERIARRHHRDGP